MHSLAHRLLSTVRTHGLTPPGTRGLVCVSGGPDSLALLHLLHALRDVLDVRLDVLHFDHGLRPTSPAEADWVARQAGHLGLPCHVVRARHLADLAAQGRGVQAAARAWRQSEARRLAAQWEAHWIATGHQRDDQHETLLLKALRGAHLSGLRGMAWQRGLFVRPLLETPRAELLAYLREHGLDWLEDPTNQAPRYKRNRVRHELLPLLDALAPGGIAPRLATLAAQSAQYEALLAQLLARHAPAESPPDARVHWIDAAALTAQAAELPALAAHALHRFVTTRLPAALSAERTAEVLALLAEGRPDWELHLSARRRLRRRGERLLLDTIPATPARTAAEPRTQAADRSEGPLPARPQGSLADSTEAWVTHQLETGAGALRVLAPPGWRVRSAGPDEDPAGVLVLHGLPSGALLHARHRAPGDRFRPPWRPRAVKLAAFLRDQRVPLWQRAELPVLLLDGCVVAVGPRFVAHGYDRPLDAAPPLRLVVEPG